jgi:exodeoxyribonuclease VII large subunit
VCRGGGSLTDLWAFCDEALCRTVALLRLPVISAVGHESDRTLIDDVAAVCCSTPTHAADALVPVDVNAARGELRSFAQCTARSAAGSVALRGRRLAELGRAPQRSIRLERGRLHQLLRETRASALRGNSARLSLAARHALVLSRKQESFERATLKGELQRLEALVLAERAHDPDRTLDRGYALIAGDEGDPITSAGAAAQRDEVAIRFADGTVPARIDRDDGHE